MQSRILIQFKESIYRLLNFELAVGRDGSFYIFFVRRGETDNNWTVNLIDGKAAKTEANEKKPRTVKVSYHASGSIRYHTLSNEGVYAEPIFNITKPFHLITYSIPSIKDLDEYDKRRKGSDFIIEFPDDTSNRINFHFIIAPWNYILPDSFSIRFEQLFSFNVLFDSEVLPIPENLDKHFHYLTPSTGFYESSPIDEDTALILFHQKINNTQGSVIYSPNKEGVYKLIFTVPKRIPPRVKIVFEETGLQIEEQKKTKSYLTFKIKDKYGQTVKDEKKIIEITLDARF